MSVANLLDFGFYWPRLAAQREIAGYAQIRRRAGDRSRAELDHRKVIAIEHFRAEHALLDLGFFIGGPAGIFDAQRLGLDFELDGLASFIHAARSQRRADDMIVSGE